MNISCNDNHVKRLVLAAKTAKSLSKFVPAAFFLNQQSPERKHALIEHVLTCKECSPKIEKYANFLQLVQKAKSSGGSK